MNSCQFVHGMMARSGENLYLCAADDFFSSMSESTDENKDGTLCCQAHNCSELSHFAVGGAQSDNSIVSCQGKAMKQ